MALVALAFLVFYILIPVAGARQAVRRWAEFRRLVAAAQSLPEADYSALHGPGAEGPARMTGALEAFEGDDRLWIGNGRLSVAVALEGTPVYFLDQGEDPFGPGAEPPRRVEAAGLGVLPEGIQFFVSGPLSSTRSGPPVFVPTPTQGLLVLAFEGDPETVLDRALHAGRSPMPLWNPWTPAALGLGVFLLSILAYAEARPDGDGLAGRWSLALALMPATFFLPPGFLLFYGFTRLWAQARMLRSAIARGRPGPQPWKREAGGLALLALGAGLNASLLGWLLEVWGV